MSSEEPQFVPNQIASLSKKWESVRIRVKPRRLKQGKDLVQDGFDLDFEAFLEAYEALLPVVKLMGAPFIFVEKDVTGKMKHLRSLHISFAEKIPETQQNYMMSGLLQTEIREDLLKTENNSFGRTFLRLNRALHFVELFVGELESTDKELREIAHGAYQQSMAPFHPWLVKKMVGVALYTLPSAKTFLGKIECHKDETNANETLKRLVSAIGSVRQKLDAFFKEQEIDQWG